MKTFNVSEAKANLGRIIKEVKKGKTYKIAERNIPVATIQAIEETVKPAKKIKLGVLKGKFTVPNNFDQPLQDFEKNFYSEINE